jgi:hypothetical protein
MRPQKSDRCTFARVFSTRGSLSAVVWRGKTIYAREMLQDASSFGDQLSTLQSLVRRLAAAQKLPAPHCVEVSAPVHQLRSLVSVHIFIITITNKHEFLEMHG